MADESAHIKGYKTITLSDDHEGMCKCSGTDDVKYKTLLGVLRRWVTELKETSKADTPQEVSTALSRLLGTEQVSYNDKPE